MGQIDTHFPATVSSDTFAAIRKAEPERAIELVTEGHLQRIRRVPPTLSSRSIWRASRRSRTSTRQSSVYRLPYVVARIHAVARSAVRSFGSAGIVKTSAQDRSSAPIMKAKVDPNPPPETPTR
jgi:muconolactone delta-isomerase